MEENHGAGDTPEPRVNKSVGAEKINFDVLTHRITQDRQTEIGQEFQEEIICARPGPTTLWLGIPAAAAALCPR